MDKNTTENVNQGHEVPEMEATAYFDFLSIISPYHLVGIILPLTSLTICFIKNGYTPLHYVSQKGDVDMAKLLIDKGANIHEKDYVRHH